MIKHRSGKWRMVIIGDTHSNSVWGLARPGFQPSANSCVPSTPLRNFLFESWLDFSEKVNQEPIDLIIVNGDPCDGFSDQSKGIGSWSPKKEDHILAFKDTFKELHRYKCPRIVGTKSTGNHAGTRRGILLDEEIAESLRADGLNATYAPKFIDVVSGHYFLIKHQVGRGSNITPELMLKRTIKDLAEAMVKGREEARITDFYINHQHQSFMFGNLPNAPGPSCYLCPCWQGITDFMSLQGSGFKLPDIGGMIVEIEDRLIKTTPILYEMPVGIAHDSDSETEKNILQFMKESSIPVVNLFPTLGKDNYDEKRKMLKSQVKNSTPVIGKDNFDELRKKLKKGK